MTRVSATRFGHGSRPGNVGFDHLCDHVPERLPRRPAERALQKPGIAYEHGLLDILPYRHQRFPIMAHMFESNVEHRTH